jgi:nitronate monooxygenase
MLVDAKAADIVYTPAISGVPGNFLRQSIAAAGRNPDDPTPPAQLDFGTTDAKAWKDIWAAGQGVGGIENIPSVRDLCGRLAEEYEQSLTGALNLSFRQKHKAAGGSKDVARP